MATKKNNYIEKDLEWLEARATDIKKSIDSKPYEEIVDRIIPMQTPKGMVDRLVAKIEDQEKAIREALKDYALLIEAIKALREIEEEKKDSVRGDTDLTPFESGDIE